MKLATALAAGAMLLVAAAGCSRQHAPVSQGSLVIALPEPISLDPIYLEGVYAYEFGELGFSYLTNYDSNNNIIPDVAREVPTKANGGISADGRAITFRLRHGVRWQDGEALTARDVVFTYHAVMNPRNTLPSRYGFDRIVSVTTPNPYTVVVRTAQPFSPIITWFIGGDSNYPILPAHLLERYGSLDHAAYNQQPIGSGPFIYGRWFHGDRVALTTNDRYYAGRPGLSGIGLRFIPDSSTIVNQLFTREVDATFFADVSKIETLRRIADHRIIVTPVPFIELLFFNLRDPLTADPKVRRAFAEAIDRNVVVNKTTHGLYGADTGMRGLFTWAYDPSAGNVPHDPPAAAALLDSDGWKAGPDGIRTKNGRRLEIQLADYTGTAEPNDPMATVIAAQERAIGIDVVRKRYSVQEFFLTGGPIKSGHFQVGLAQFQDAGDPDASWMLACDQQPPGGFNDAFYCNRDVDGALARARTEFDRASRKKEYAFVQRQLLKDLPYYIIAQVSEIDVIPTWLQGYERPLLSPFVSVARWH
ncbi:MAG: peptide ABC transporter substrate-binding protein [Candidatus Eremiobacteraeota bacterium]|nr:peptide ABC transporter substrate-binding protein [Candidatus Eremiobacteraeota bacterium]